MPIFVLQISDFGLARVKEEAASVLVTATQHAGTVQYQGEHR
jgi:hypothetical protein